MYKRSSQAERDLALKWARQGKPPSKIASLLDRAPGTISRQLAKLKGPAISHLPSHQHLPRHLPHVDWAVFLDFL